MKQNVNWFIEDIQSDGSTKELISAARELGYNVKEADLTNPCENYADYFKGQACVVACTSIQSAGQITKQCPLWFPAVWDTPQLFRCDYYYKFFGEHLFNDRYVMLPLGEVERRLDDLCKWLGKSGCIFIRPSSGRKTFTGQVFKRERFHKDWHAVIGYGGQLTDLVVVSTPKKIRGEYRFVVDGRNVIASSEYSWEGEGPFKEAPDSLVDYAETVLSGTDYNPAPVWILDVALDDDLTPRVLEVGSFNCSGLYGCDKKKIVKRVSEIALKEYGEFFGV